MSDRGVSTVIDVALCLVLVGAAVATVTSVQPPDPAGSGDVPGETAATLATSTATVTYSLSAAAAEASDDAFDRTDGPGFERTKHGTLAALLAGAALANLSWQGETLDPAGPALVEAVRAAVAPVLDGPDWDGQVVARWTPYPGASLAGVVTVGDAPPPDVDVHTATLAVRSGVTHRGRPLQQVAAAGATELAATLARDVVRSRFPVERTHTALLGAYPEPGLTKVRYRRFAGRFGTTVDDLLADRSVAAANDRVAAAMVDDLVADLLSRFRSPSKAAAAVDLGTVTVTVRTWSP